MKVFFTDASTGEFFGEGLADKSPLEEGVWLIPAGAYMDAPPEPVEGKAVVRLNGSWNLIDDLRGLLVYEKSTGQENEWDKIGPISAEYTKKKPATDRDIWDGRKWITPEPEVVVPQVISFAQGKRALIRRGYWQAANDFVDSIEDETERLLAQSALHDPQEFHRTSPFLNYLAGMLEIPDSEIDEMFIEGVSDII